MALLAIAVLSFWFYINLKAVSNNPNYVDFLITKGASASQVANKLQQEGLVKNAFAFKFYVQITGTSQKIQSGEFKLSPSLSIPQIVNQFLKGPVELWTTIPEGLRREEVAARFAASLQQDQLFVNDFIKMSEGLEGRLFPDTYLFPKDASATSIVNKMVATFNSKTDGLGSYGGLDFGQRLVLASLLERETKTDAERPVVAGILVKRLQAGWPLQVDAAVQYAVANVKCQVDNIAMRANFKCADWWPVLTKEDLEINSPYNTYKFGGIPPFPISSPGISSIKAAFNPEDSDYWYYIHGNDGRIRYAKTLEEHNANIAKYLR